MVFQSLENVCEKYDCLFDETYAPYTDMIVELFNGDTSHIIDTDDTIRHYIYGLYYQFKVKNYVKMMKYYQMAIEKGHVKAM